MKPITKLRLQSVMHQTHNISASFEQQRRMVVGMTVERLKTRLRSEVPQHQGRFMAAIRAAGFTASWSREANAFVVHEPRTDFESFRTFTAMVGWPNGEGEEIDVLAPDEASAAIFAREQLRFDYMPGGTIKKMVARVPGTFFI